MPDRWMMQPQIVVVADRLLLLLLLRWRRRMCLCGEEEKHFLHSVQYLESDRARKVPLQKCRYLECDLERKIRTTTRSIIN